MKTQCVIAGCSSTYLSNEEPSKKGVRYVCSHHTRQEQLAAIERTEDKGSESVCFQEYAFDKDLKTRINNRQPFTGKLPDRPEFPKSSLNTETE